MADAAIAKAVITSLPSMRTLACAGPDGASAGARES